jgi:hypothetical protein
MKRSTCLSRLLSFPSSFILYPSSFLLLLLLTAGAAGADPEVEADERLVREAKVGVDAPGLLAFFQERTLAPPEVLRLEELVRELGNERFDRRELATKELVRRGEPAVPFLRRALRDADAEVVRRAGLCLEEIAAAGKGPALPSAAARLLARRAAPGAATILLAYLPFAEDAGVEAEVTATLVALSRPAEEDRLWRAALAAPETVVRAAAARVLSRKGEPGQREAVRPLLKDRDFAVRYQAAEGLLGAGERDAVPALISLLTDGPMELALQAEEILFLLASDKAPMVNVLDGGGLGRKKCKVAWEAWWAGPGAQADLARAADRRQLLGLTLGIEYNTGRVWECGRDGRVRWELTGLQGPMEAQVLPGGRVLVAEANNQSLSERDFKGNICWQRPLGAQPTGCQRLANGNVFVSTFNSVRELDRDGKEVYSFKLATGSNAIRKHRNGHVIYAVDGEIVEVDTAGRKVRSVRLPRGSMYVGIQDLPGDHFLVANSSTGQLLEVDAAGKVVWSAAVSGACGVSRLPNGNTLVGVDHRVVELNRDGQKVWQRETAGYVRRVHQR